MTWCSFPLTFFAWNLLCFLDLWVYAAAAKSLQSSPTLCNPVDSSPPGSPIPGTLQARTLEWAAISFSNAWKGKWSHSVVSDSLQPHGLQPTRLLSPRDFPGNTTGVGCHCLLHCGFIPFSKFGKNLSALQILLRSHSFSLFFEDLLIHGFGCWKFFYISLILQIFFSNLFIHFVSFWILVNFPCSQQCPISH